MQTLELCHLMVFGVFWKIIWSRGYSKKFTGEEIFGSCGAGESKYYTFSRFDHSSNEFKYADTHIANLEGRELGTFIFDDPPRVYMNFDKTVNGVSAEFSMDSKSEQIQKWSINN